jgi:hypothetical protein
VVDATKALTLDAYIKEKLSAAAGPADNP